MTQLEEEKSLALQAHLARGAVAVAYSGCELEVLDACEVEGAYRWQTTTLSTDSTEIRNQDDLYAKLPVGAATLEGELKRRGHLSVKTTVAGQYRLTQTSPSDVPNAGACERATHLVMGAAVGAFRLESKGGIEGSVSAAGVTAEGGDGDAEQALVSRGSAAACSEGAREGAPPEGCDAPLQVFLAPIPGRGGAVEEGPPGFVKASFVSERDYEGEWRVSLDDNRSCTTPCEAWVDPARPIVIARREREDLTLRFPEAKPGDSVAVVANGRKKKRINAGAVALVFGAAALASGAFITGLAYATDPADGVTLFKGEKIVGPVLLGVGVPLLVISGVVIAGGASSADVNIQRANASAWTELRRPSVAGG